MVSSFWFLCLWPRSLKCEKIIISWFYFEYDDFIDNHITFQSACTARKLCLIFHVCKTQTLLGVGGVRLFIIPTLLRMLDCQRITHHIFLKLLNMILLDIMYYLLKKKPKYFIFKFLNFFIQSSVLKRGKINRALKWLENCFSNRNGPSDFQFWIYWELRSLRPPLCNHQTLTILIQSF